MDTPGHDPGTEAARMFARLGEVLYAGQEYTHAYQAICSAAQLLVTSCDHASLLMRKGKQLATAAATDDVARTVDRFERQIRTGPCYDATWDPAPQLAPDITEEDAPWPELRHLVLASTPVRGMLGFRIMHAGHKLAALNLFSDRAGGFTDAGVDQAAVLAAFCTVALQAATDHHEVASLRDGLSSNREIGKAIGLLMAYHKVSDEEAFQMLRSTSNDLNLKLSLVAEQVVAGHNMQLQA